MKKEILNYNLHDILRIKIVMNRRCGLMRILNPEYSFFEVNKVDNPDIILNIGKFQPSNDDCYVVDSKYYIKENYFYCKDSENNVRWEVELFGFEEGPMIVNIDIMLPWARAMIPLLGTQIFLLSPLIEYKLHEKGYFLIHSAGVSKDNQAFLFAGRGGAFKTTLAMDFVRKAGFSFLGDERVIIHKNKTLSYPWDFIGFNFKCEHLPTEEYRGFFDRVRLVNYIRNNYGNQDNLKINVANSSELKFLFIVSRKNKQKKVVIKSDMNLEETINRLIINNEMEMTTLTMPNLRGFASNPYFKYMLAYSFIFPDSGVATYWNDMRRGLKEVFRNVPVYEVEVPYTYSVEVFNRIYEQIKEIE